MPFGAYAAVPLKDEDDRSDSGNSRPHVWWKRESRIVRYGVILLVLETSLLLILAAISINRHILGQSSLLDTASLLKLTSGYSPIFDRYPFRLGPVYQNNTLFSDNVLRQRPNPATEAAWNELSRLTVLTLTPDEVRKLGQDPAEAVHMPGDPTAFPAMLSVTHQMHCLNHIRKGLEAAHYLQGQERSRHDWEHLYHCLHFLTQIATCHADVDPIFWRWFDDIDQPQPDFSGDKVCRDFPGMKTWLDGVGFSVLDLWEFRREGGEINHPVEPGYLQYLAEEAKHSHDKSS